MRGETLLKRGLSTRWGIAAGLLVLGLFGAASSAGASVPTPVPKAQRGTIDAERSGTHDAANIRTIFWNYGMVGDYPADPLGVDLSVFHSAEAPKGSGMNYSDGITPFVLAKIRTRSGLETYIMETGFRERQAISPYTYRVMRFEPRPGYFQADPRINPARSPAVSNDPRTWPATWPDKLDDPFDPGWTDDWNGYFGKQPVADQESYVVMDDDYYDSFDFYPDSRDSTRRGLGLRVEVRGFQWANPQASNVVFWHYDITNEGTTDYDDNIIFGLYMDSGVGGSAFSCDQIPESDDDNAFFDRRFNQDVLNLVYTWDRFGHGLDLSGCDRTGYLGYAYLETPGNGLDGIDNDEDGILNELRDGGPGEQIVGEDAIRDYVNSHYTMARFTNEYGPLERRPAYRRGEWWTGDEDMDWTSDLHDVGADGVAESGDPGEGDGMPTDGEPNFDRTDLNESDQIGLTGFKVNRIRAGKDNPDQTTDGILFYTEDANWPQRLFEKFSSPDSATRFDQAFTANANIGFLFASGPFKLPAGKTERFSLALAFGGDLGELRRTVKTVQQIYDANYRFAVPPSLPTVTAETGDGYVRLSWGDISERSADPVTGEVDFEGYRIYRSTDPTFLDPRVITTGTGSGPIGNGRPIAQYDLVNQKQGFSEITVEGVAYYLGNDTGIRHTWTDTAVVNGQQYYYAVTAYDYGSDSLGFYPSENAISASRTPRGGLVLPPNIVGARPEPRVSGFVSAGIGEISRLSGRGAGTVEVEVVNSGLIPDGHLMRLDFHTPSPDSIQARWYTLRDSTAHVTLIANGRDFSGTGIGTVGGGMLPIVWTPRGVSIDTENTGFTEESSTNVRLTVDAGTSLPANLLRPGYPDDISIFFSDDFVDTSTVGFNLPAVPVKFRVVAHTQTGDLPLDFRFKDLDGDGQLSVAGKTNEYIYIVTYRDEAPTSPQNTWQVYIDPATPTPIDPPGAGDVFELKLIRPFTANDSFVFTTQGEKIDPALAAEDFKTKPYVVPNPYVGAASFEPERFAVSGRGERRMEFRGLPSGATIRIYTVRGELVQTLAHDGSDEGMVPWNLRTKDNLDVAPGLYIYHVDGGSLGTHVDKFAIIK
jgi:hypothetical protein